MSSRSDADFLADIKEALKRIALYTGDMSYEIFVQDIKTQDAVVRNLEIIGEAVKNLSNELRDKHPEIPWKKITGARDKLIHNYFGVNFDIVWGIIRKDLPELTNQIENIPTD